MHSFPSRKNTLKRVFCGCSVGDFFGKEPIDEVEAINREADHCDNTEDTREIEILQFLCYAERCEVALAEGYGDELP